MNKKSQKQINLHNDEMAVLTSSERFNRARSVTVGTCFNGVTEISMRGDGKYLWCPMQPVEVIELIHQLAANVGCHINLQPRKDFSSWRKWGEDFSSVTNSAPSVVPRGNHPPLANETSDLNNVQAQIAQKDTQNETVATEKPKHKRSAKRTAAPA